jgi:hypothetical protein
MLAFYVVVFLFLNACAAPSNRITQAAPSDRITQSERDALYRQLTRSWVLPMAAEDVQGIVVPAVRLGKPGPDCGENRDPRSGTLRPRSDVSRRCPECGGSDRRIQPLALPPGKYAVWHELLLNFSPQDV